MCKGFNLVRRRVDGAAIACTWACLLRSPTASGIWGGTNGRRALFRAGVEGRQAQQTEEAFSSRNNSKTTRISTRMHVLEPVCTAETEHAEQISRCPAGELGDVHTAPGLMTTSRDSLGRFAAPFAWCSNAGRR